MIIQMKGGQHDSLSLTYLESRLRTTEDKLAIYEQIASYPPSADTGHVDYTLSVYSKYGEFDRGPTLDGEKAIAAF